MVVRFILFNYTSMEKLIELLNQHRIEKTDIQYELELPMPMRDWRFILSREYWFIKRLVDNDKIEWSKLKRVFYKQNENNTATYPVMSAYSDYECLLMLLSIQDNPIEFLISILK